MNRSAFRFPQPARGLPFNGERYVSGLLGNAASGDIQSEHYHRYLFALRFCDGKDVLDIASGEGYGSYCLSQVARSVIGVDVNTEAVDFANRNYLSDRISFRLGKAQAIPIADRSIDVVVSFETLEHFKEHETFAAEVRRVLRPGGLLVISSPNRAVYTEEADYHNEWHLRELDRGEFLDYLSRSFSHVRMFAQRHLVGSVIVCDDGQGGSQSEGFILHGDCIFHRTENVPHPPFFVALASDAELPEARSSVLQNPALLLDIDAQRQQATDLAERSSAHAANLESALATNKQEQLDQTATLGALLDAARAEAEQARRAEEATRNLLGERDAALATAKQEHVDQTATVVALLDVARAEAEQARRAEETTRNLLAERDAAATLQSAAAERDATEARCVALMQDLESERAAGQRNEAALRNILTSERNVATAQSQIILDLKGRIQHLADEVVALRAALHAIEQSTFWQMTWPLRRGLRIVPVGVRRLGRRALQAGWWIVTLRLPHRILKLRAVVADPAPSVEVTVPPLIVAEQSAAPAPSVDVAVPSLIVAERPAAEPEPTIVLPDLVACRTLLPRGRIAVVVHVYFIDIWPELETALRAIEEPFDLFVSVTEDAGSPAVDRIRASYPQALVYVFPNHGRDIMPFLAFAETGALNRYTFLRKLHTKRSVHREDGNRWRQELVGGILYDPACVRRILEAFETEPDLGIVVADGNIYGDDPDHWRDNRRLVLDLGHRIGITEIPPGGLFPGGSIYWIRPFLLRTLAAIKATPADFEREPLRLDGSAVHAIERLVGLVTADAGMYIATASNVMSRAATLMASGPQTYIIAYYLPQFHPVPENDAWWGKGFTEWSNVTRATPQFRGHRQPRLPTDLGFYDLRLPQVREAQAELARAYGISAFCYYYYWFDGRGILRQPLDDMLTSGRPDFPFLLCWANEPWTRNWDGGNREVLLPQTYRENWPKTFAHDVAAILADPRYFRLEGRPVLLIYRVMHIPAAPDAFARLRVELRRLGVGEIHLAGGWVGFADDAPLPTDPTALGLDAFFGFPPHMVQGTDITDQLSERAADFTGRVYSYDSMIQRSLTAADVTANLRRHSAAMLGWDNTARRLHLASVVHGATPAKFRRWLRGLLRAERDRPGTSDRLVFINAWNEWGEGAYLEPDRDFGHGWLEAVASAATEPIAPLVASSQAAVAEVLAADTSSEPAPPLSDEKWLRLVIAQAEGDATGPIQLPPLPAAAWQAQFVGSSNAHAMREAFAFYILLKNQMAERRVSLSRQTRVLDFGCGWGRFIRLFMKDIAPEALHGADVDPDMIGFCRISGLPAQFAVLPPFGPSPYADASFDLIFAYSVFSHLSEGAYRAWMREFARILRPGGLLVLTTQARRFLEWTATLRDRPEAELSNWERSLRFAFGDISAALRDHESGQFIFAPTGGGNHRPSSFYGEAVIPEVYIRATATGPMALEEFIDDAAVCPQAIVVMRKQPIGAKETNFSPAASMAPHPRAPAQALPNGAKGHGSRQVSDRSNDSVVKIVDGAATRNGLSYPLVPRDAWLEIVAAAYQGQHDSRVPTCVLPGFPPDELQIATTGHAGRATLVEAYTFYVDCAETFERLGRPLKRASIVLDFGVGWGRVGRFFLNDIAPENLIGIDVDHTLVTICRSLFSASQFEVCSSHPPTGLASRSLDFVVGYSVFSHLSEAACIAWMCEFRRLLRPGGIAALTTRGRWFLDYCASLRDTATDGYARGLSTLFSDFEAATARYDSGELVFSTNSDVAGGVRDSSFYGETFIPESYAARAFPDMKLAEFQFEAGHHTHPIMFFVRQG